MKATIILAVLCVALCSSCLGGENVRANSRCLDTVVSGQGPEDRSGQPAGAG